MEFYQTLLHFFIDPTQMLLATMGDHLLESLKLPLNALLTLALMGWAYQRVRLGDLFHVRTLFSLAGFALFFVLFNYAWRHPQDFYRILRSLVFYGSDVLMELVRSSLQHTGNAHLDFAFLVNQTFHTLGLILQTMDTSRFDASSLLGVALLFSQGALLTLLLALALMVAIEIYLWLALGVLVLPLGFFASTRKILWLYVRKCVALSFYQPLIILLAFYNARVLETLIPTLSTLQAYETHLFVIISTLLEVFLVQRIPRFIHALCDTHGGVQDVMQLASVSKTSLLQSVGALYPTTAPYLHQSNISNTHTSSSSQEMSLHIQTLSDSKPHIDTTTIGSKYEK
ncbi:hypothetical protein [Helicobacter vulpis]|uniref:hypothetical protein n=1 Tax=Helicobacter vulpis TaxID=2316076 RepID=UPI000EB3FFF7|nr:hypothetical protein [Helicobacter vulpis]